MIKLLIKIVVINVTDNPAIVAWIITALLSHSVEEYILAIGGSNPA